MSGYFSKYKKNFRTEPKERNKSKTLVAYTINIPHWMSQKLENEKKEKNLSTSLIVMRALQNEFVAETPFANEIAVPSKKYDEDYSSPAQQKLFDFIKANPGFGLEWLFFLSKDFGVSDKVELANCIRDLLEKELIILTDVKNFKGQPTGRECFKIHPRIVADIARQKGIPLP